MNFVAFSQLQLLLDLLSLPSRSGEKGDSLDFELIESIQTSIVFNMLIEMIRKTEPDLPKDKIQLKMSRWLKNPNTHFGNEAPLGPKDQTMKTSFCYSEGNESSADSKEAFCCDSNCLKVSECSKLFPKIQIFDFGVGRTESLIRAFGHLRRIHIFCEARLFIK